MYTNYHVLYKYVHACMCMHVQLQLFLSMCVGAQLEMFGSSANGFGSKNSDLDICLTLPGHDKV